MSARVEKTTLPSGITVLAHPMPDRPSVSVALWVRTGARDESEGHTGITHFVEHMMFKGTPSRDARAIASSLEALGGQLDAFTSREQVCYEARALSEHLPDAIEVLADITCRSNFDPREIEREKSVVREEILQYEDNPEDKVGEQLMAQLWGGHALGRPILGTAASVDALDREAIREHFASRFAGRELVVAGAGGLTLAGLVALVERWFAPPAGGPAARDVPPPAFVPSVLHEVCDLQQLYLSLGTRAIPYMDPRRYALAVLETLLGGCASSRLYQRIREEAALAYSVYSALDQHRDAGALSIHLSVTPDRARQALGLLREELARLAGEGPSEAEVDATRTQIKGSILIRQESTSGRMHHVARQEIYAGKYTSPDEQVARIMAVTREQVAALAAEFLAPGRFALAARGPGPGGALTETDWPLDGDAR
jgi:predicted Zn-dependent peptidase